MDGGSFNADSNIAWQRIVCCNCSLEWEDTYELTDIDNVYDENGDEVEVVE